MNGNENSWSEEMEKVKNVLPNEFHSTFSRDRIIEKFFYAYILELCLQAMLCSLRAFSFHFVEFLVCLCQFLVHVVNKIVVSCFPIHSNE